MEGTILFDSPSDTTPDPLIGPGVAAVNLFAGESEGGMEADSHTTPVQLPTIVPIPPIFGTKTPTKLDMPKPIMGDIVRINDETTVA
jgi:hypothetical protein